MLFDCLSHSLKLLNFIGYGVAEKAFLILIYFVKIT